MSASLVGSEMCIRDRGNSPREPRAPHELRRGSLEFHARAPRESGEKLAGEFRRRAPSRAPFRAPSQ
eukprot:8905710-Alexandrium_andersonii.AAC.1